jgi:hypothetical protein
LNNIPLSPPSRASTGPIILRAGGGALDVRFLDHLSIPVGLVHWPHRNDVTVDPRRACTSCPYVYGITMYTCAYVSGDAYESLENNIILRVRASLERCTFNTCFMTGCNFFHFFFFTIKAAVNDL